MYLQGCFRDECGVWKGHFICLICWMTYLMKPWQESYNTVVLRVWTLEPVGLQLNLGSTPSLSLFLFICNVAVIVPVHWIVEKMSGHVGSLKSATSLCLIQEKYNWCTLSAITVQEWVATCGAFSDKPQTNGELAHQETHPIQAEHSTTKFTS